MAIDIEVTRDTAHFVTHEPRSSFASLLHELALLSDNAKVTPFANVREVARFGGAVYPSAYSVLHDVALLSDAVFPSLTYDVTTRDVFYASDAISAANRAFVQAHELAIVHGYAVTAPGAKLREVALLSDAIHWFSTGTQALREVARLSDAVYPSNAATLHDVALLDDAMLSHLRSIVVLREKALLSDATAPLFIVRGTGTTLREVALLSDRALINVLWSGGAALHEVFYADDRAIPPPSGRAYTCSILTWGMSTYANYPFLTKASKYAAGQNLWRLDALDDYGTPLDAWLVTGAVDLGVARGKRPSAIYVDGSASAPLDVWVLGDVQGVQQGYTYTLDLRDQTNYRNNRALLGKGFRSRYLQFKLRATKYLGFRLLTAELDVAVSPRRVG